MSNIQDEKNEREEGEGKIKCKVQGNKEGPGGKIKDSGGLMVGFQHRLPL
jgi:hypothetical protein